MKSDIAIKLTNVSKRYYPHSNKPTLLENINPFKKTEEFWALRNINLTIKKGERIGITGQNGAGKTTLLKIIAGITKPTSGSIEINGKIVSLIELTAGFQPELSGRKNITINALFANMDQNEIKQKTSKMIHFSGLKSFIDKPFYTYSAGMKFRLAFAIAITSNCDILLIDEILSSGDALYQNKVISSIRHLQEQKNMTTISVSSIPVFLLPFAQRFYEVKEGTITPKDTKNILSRVINQENSWKKTFPYDSINTHRSTK